MKKMYESEKLEDEIYDIVEKKYPFDEIIQKHNSYEYNYYLSNLRENLFVWYPFKEDANLLEVGGGYGALTKLFCKKVKNVVSIEDTPEKAEIISKRCNSDNLKALVNDFSRIEQLYEKFDYIVLTDFLEYANYFFNSSNPFKNYLIYLKRFLKKDGVILLSISNRFGLKYFAGFKEEHVNEYFSGIDGFPKHNVQTFTKGEIEEIINSAGFTNYKFFYPYPDHIFPIVINTDKFINKIIYERKATVVKERANFFRENKVNQTLSDENISQYFSNSFLIELRNDDSFKETDNYDYIKINAERQMRYRTITYIYSNHDKTKVVKTPLNIFSENHIKRMYESSKYKFGKIKFLESSYENNEFSYPYIEHESFEKILINAINNNDIKEFFDLLKKYHDALFYDSFKTDEYCTPEFLEIFKEKSDKCFSCHNITNIDVIFSNLFLINDEFVSIDYEWVFDFPIPLEYIFYRVIHHHHVVNPIFRDFITISEIFEYFNLDMDNVELFEEWDKNFLSHANLRLKKPKTKITSKSTVMKLDRLNKVLKDDKDMNKKYQELSIKYQDLLIKYQELNLKYQDITNK